MSPIASKPPPSFVLGFVRLAVLVALLLFAVGASAAGGGVEELQRRLATGVDFRVRVQAALELGKSRSEVARLPLEKALADENAAVRASAAAALKVLGDPRSLPELRKAAKDPSSAVRAQIQSTVTALESVAKKKAMKPEVVVQMGTIVLGKPVARGKEVEADARRASRERLADLPGVLVDDDEPTPRKPAKKQKSASKVPVVMVTGRVRELQHTRQGDNLTCSASIEFVMHKMPGRSISSVVRGSARASSQTSGNDRADMDDLRRSALEAAIESALRNAPEAIRAAAR
jgi:hypothetical protein